MVDTTETTRQNSKLALGAAGCVALLLLALRLPAKSSRSLCGFRLITGFECPGCGLTRGMMEFLRGELSAAMTHHPLTPLCFALALFVTAICLWDFATRGRAFERLLARWGVPSAIVFSAILILVWVFRRVLAT